MSKDVVDEAKMKEKKYEVSLETRNFEIELFWKRSIFFWGFIGLSFIAYATLMKFNDFFLAVFIASFGFVCSVAWSLVNRGSKFWQENWEIKVSDIEDDITGSLFKVIESRSNKGIWLSSRRFSVSKVTIALSDFTIFIWFLLLLYPASSIFKATLNPIYLPTKNMLIVAIIFGSIIFSLFMIVFGRSGKGFMVMLLDYLLCGEKFKKWLKDDFYKEHFIDFKLLKPSDCEIIFELCEKNKTIRLLKSTNDNYFYYRAEYKDVDSIPRSELNQITEDKMKNELFRLSKDKYVELYGALASL